MIYFYGKQPHAVVSCSSKDSIDVDLSKKRTSINYICISQDLKKGYSISMNESDFDLFTSFEKDLKEIDVFKNDFIFIAVENDLEIWRRRVDAGTMEMIKNSKSGFWLLRDLFSGEDFPKNKKVDVLDKNGNQITHKGLYKPYKDIQIKDFTLSKETVFEAHFLYLDKALNNALFEELLPIKNIVNFSIKADEDIGINIRLPSNEVIPAN